MFTELNTVEQMVLETLSSAGRLAEREEAYVRKGVTRRTAELGWRYVPAKDLPRKTSEVFVEPMLRDALVRLNPEIGQRPDLADEVLYRLRDVPITVAEGGLVRSNELFSAWMRGDKTMPFGPNNEHTSVRLIDFDDPENNDFVVTNQWTFRAGEIERVRKR